jgi:hypothetical protein
MTNDSKEMRMGADTVWEVANKRNSENFEIMKKNTGIYIHPETLFTGLRWKIFHLPLI